MNAAEKAVWGNAPDEPRMSLQERTAALLPPKPRTGADSVSTVTIREWFACHALQGILAADGTGNSHGQERNVERAVNYADRMVAALAGEATARPRR